MARVEKSGLLENSAWQLGRYSGLFWLSRILLQHMGKLACWLDFPVWKLLHLPPEMTVDVPIIFLRQWRRSQQERSTAVAGIYRCQVIVLGVRGA